MWSSWCFDYYVISMALVWTAVTCSCSFLLHIVRRAGPPSPERLLRFRCLSPPAQNTASPSLLKPLCPPLQLMQNAAARLVFSPHNFSVLLVIISTEHTLCLGGMMYLMTSRSCYSGFLNALTVSCFWRKVSTKRMWCSGLRCSCYDWGLL